MNQLQTQIKTTLELFEEQINHQDGYWPLAQEYIDAMGHPREGKGLCIEGCMMKALGIEYGSGYTPESDKVPGYVDIYSSKFLSSELYKFLKYQFDKELKSYYSHLYSYNDQPRSVIISILKLAMSRAGGVE